MYLHPAQQFKKDNIFYYFKPLNWWQFVTEGNYPILVSRPWKMPLWKEKVRGLSERLRKARLWPERNCQIPKKETKRLLKRKERVYTREGV
jgi:hypothetical protein